MTVLQAEVRRRLWATILEINLQASLDSGVPLAISYDDFDTDSPGNVNDTDISESTNALACQADNTATDMSLQLLLLKYLRPRAEIIRRTNGAYSNFSQDEVQSITSILSKACRECSAKLRSVNGDAVEVFKHNMVDLLLRRFLLTLHRPLATASRVSNPTFHFSRKVCLDSATALLSPPQNTEFSHLVLLGSGIFKSRIIHASLAICSDLIIELEELGPMGWPSTYRKMLVGVLREAVRQAAERIALGETNLRLHMKLNIVLCHTECTESGSARQLRMVQAAQESLEKSYTLMQSRLGLAVGEQYDEGAPECQQFGCQDLGVALDEDWDEPYDMADIGLDELLWSGLGAGGTIVSHEAE
ncbi:c6 zinc finger domain [Trichoderma arundinaceum]|uniref:C6 zinc finger domain n=1 Tax=Trichoderma arundinaceum TaxID=490622 RepID=A0A395NA66_TRIAR|nr:c6 zinc finger domain [Trichoderma arundinaceum]